LAERVVTKIFKRYPKEGGGEYYSLWIYLPRALEMDPRFP